MRLSELQALSPHLHQRYGTAKRHAPLKSSNPGASAARFSGALSPTLWQSVGLKTNNLLAWIFRPVLENLFIGIMVVDFFALWLPRVFDALYRGSYPYHPEKDPKLKGKTGWNAVKHKTFEQLKRLNWTNAWEETWREVASGPAVFLGPTLAFMAARRLYGKAACEIGVTPFKQYGITFFKDYLDKTNVTDKQYRQSLEQFFSKLFGDDKMRRTAMPKGGTYGKFFDDWSKRLVDVFYESKGVKFTDFAKRKQLNASLDALKAELTENVRNYNRLHLPDKQFYRYEEVPIKWFKATTNRQFVLDRTKDGKLPTRAAGQVFDELVRFKDFVFQVDKARIKFPNKSLGKLSQNIRRNITSLKMLYSITAIGATLAFLFKLVQWSQSNEHYVANRLVKLEDLEKELTSLKANKNKPRKTAPKKRATKSPRPEPTFVMPPPQLHRQAFRQTGQPWYYPPYPAMGLNSTNPYYYGQQPVYTPYTYGGFVRFGHSREGQR